MKMSFAVFGVLSSLAGSGALAAGPSAVCSKYFACGTYEGAGRYVGSNGDTIGEFQEKTTFSSLSDKQAVIEMEVTGKGDKPQSWHWNVAFDDDGAFKMTDKRGLYAAGVCKDSICTYGAVPFKSGDDQIGNSGILRFGAGKLERFMLVITPSETIHQKSDLVKK